MGLPSTLNLTAAKPSTAPKTTASPTMANRAAVRGFCTIRSIMALHQAAKAHKGQGHQAGGDQADGGALEGLRHIGHRQPLAHRGKQDQYQGEPGGGAKA